MRQINRYGLLMVISFFISAFSYGQSSKDKKLIENLNHYNVKWTSQSLNSSESMPLGGGDVGCNVWVEDGDVLFYLSRSGTFDENNQFLKLGRVRVRLEPNIFKDKTCQFSQELKLHEGYVQIQGKTSEKEMTINLWVDVYSPVVNMEINSSEEIQVSAFYENWRTKDRLLPMAERSACFSYSAYEGDVITYRDSITYVGNNVLWYHRNRSDKLLFDFCVEQQGLSEVKDQLLNTQENLTFGGVLRGEGMVPGKTGNGKYVDTPFKYWSLESEKPAKQHTIQTVMHTAQASTTNQWKKDLLSVKSKTEWNKTKEWWHQFWERSHIFINADAKDPDDKGWQVGRNYQLFRYQLGCNAYGKYPTKFNGGLFTTDPVFVKQGEKANNGTPDYRSWGGGSHTAQNQRLVYWPMLKSGDFDMMASQFDFYKRSLKNVELRTKVYWGHDGCSFTEHPETFGLPAAATWGFDSGTRKRKKSIEQGVLSNRYVNYHYANQLEFSYMILEYFKFSGEDISAYLPFIKSSLRFFDEHYQYRQMKRTGQPLDEKGKLVLYPSTAAEMYKLAKNPVDIIAALKRIIPEVIDLPAPYVTDEEREYYKSYFRRIPEISFDTKMEYTVIKPAESWAYVANMEIPELYPVFPYGLWGIGKENLDVAINTFYHGESNEKRSFTDCWSQVGIFASRLGLVDEATHLVVDKLSDSPRRFPTFWGPGPDWVPDTDHGGAGMINLQEMILQCVEDTLFVLPAWPRNWNVDFKLHVPGKTFIEGIYMDGDLKSINIDPERKSFVLHTGSVL